ncbi:unnamed protein product [Blepharisma stoltei]|uniref:Uncharacterized protein n=1 Tax=Blepharisma stoltei TaxID=1481888 RepID=A0AAU9IDX2_9CILI|nr:unnamed protein product [Blepharisma stoltei]
MCESNIERNIERIRKTLNRLGGSLIEEDFADIENSRVFEEEKKVQIKEEDLYGKSFYQKTGKYPENEMWEMKKMLDFERKRSEFLEEKVKAKDESLKDMIILQHELEATIEMLKQRNAPQTTNCDKRIGILEREIEIFKEKIKERDQKLKGKDDEITQILAEKSELNFKLNIFFKENSELKCQIKSHQTKYEELEKILNGKISDIKLLQGNLEDAKKRYLNEIEISNELRNEISTMTISLNDISKTREHDSILAELDPQLKWKNSEDKIFMNESTKPAIESYSSTNKAENIDEDKENTLEMRCKIQIPELDEISKLKEKMNQLSSKFEEINSKNKNQDNDDLIRILGAVDFKDAKDKIAKFVKLDEKYSSLKKTFKKIANLIVQCSPEGSFYSIPSPHQVWKWITRLLEEYMSLKKGSEKICNCLEAKSFSQALQIIEKSIEKFNNKHHI